MVSLPAVKPYILSDTHTATEPAMLLATAQYCKRALCQQAKVMLQVPTQWPRFLQS